MTKHNSIHNTKTTLIFQIVELIAATVAINSNCSRKSSMLRWWK